MLIRRSPGGGVRPRAEAWTASNSGDLREVRPEAVIRASTKVWSGIRRTALHSRGPRGNAACSPSLRIVLTGEEFERAKAKVLQ
jgi:hypothetical protein